MLDLINQEHSGRCVLKNPNRAGFEFMKAHGRRDIRAQGANDLCVKASKQKNGREVRRDDRSPTARLFAGFEMVALELLEKHRSLRRNLDRTIDGVYCRLANSHIVGKARESAD